MLKTIKDIVGKNLFHVQWNTYKKAIIAGLKYLEISLKVTMSKEKKLNAR